MNGIVMLVNEFPPLPVGGAETQAERLAGYLAQRQWPVWVITRHAKGLPRYENQHGIQIIRPFTAGFGKIRTITFFLSTIPVLWSLRHKYKVLHAHLAFAPALAGVIIGHFLKRSVIVKLGGSGETGDINKSVTTLRGRVRLAAFRRWADILITLSDMMRSEARAVGFSDRQLRSIPNGIDAKEFFPDRPKQAIQNELGLPNKLLVLFVGRLMPVKSLPTLLEAFANALKVCPDLHLVLVGDGPERPGLENWAAELHIDVNVTFTGNQKNVKAYLNASDIFVLPSKSEGISNALLEAMSAGLACISTSVGGGTEVLEGGKCGLLVQPGDISAWTKALVDIGTNPTIRRELGESARQRILEYYDFSVVGSRYEALYEELLSGKHKPGGDR